jgi:hypothetical protein
VANYFNIMVLPYDYDPAATCPRWQQFLDEVFGDDTESIGLLQEWFGYVLSGRTARAGLCTARARLCAARASAQLRSAGCTRAATA